MTTPLPSTPPLAADELACLDRLRADLSDRWRPVTAIEHHWLEHLALAHLRHQRLDGLEVQVMNAWRTNEPEAAGEAPRLPSLDTLIRYRRRIERDMTEAERRLGDAIAVREAMDDTNEPERNDVEPDTAWDETILPEPGPDAVTDEVAALNRRQRRRLAALMRAA